MPLRCSPLVTTFSQPSGSGYRLGSTTSNAVAPQPKAKSVQSSLLSYLDNDYFSRNDTENSFTLQSQPKPLVDATTTETVTTSTERKLDDECRGDTDDIFADAGDTQIKDAAATLTPGQKIAVVSIEEDDVIPATPPHPAAPPRSKTGSDRKSLHERQKKISDFLLKK